MTWRYDTVGAVSTAIGVEATARDAAIAAAVPPVAKGSSTLTWPGGTLWSSGTVVGPVSTGSVSAASVTLSSLITTTALPAFLIAYNAGSGYLNVVGYAATFNPGAGDSAGFWWVIYG